MLALAVTLLLLNHCFTSSLFTTT